MLEATREPAVITTVPILAIPSPHPLQMVLGEKSSLDRMPADYGPEVQSSNQAPVFQENVKERLTTQAA